MNASKLTKTQLVDMLNTRTEAHNALAVENAQLRQLNAEWAQDSKRLKIEILKLKDRLTAAAPSTSSTFQQRCAAYCAEHNVRSVPQAVAREWFRAGAGA